MECPYCGNELIWNDYFGHMQYAQHYYEYPQSWIKHEGDIYKCENENCESENFNYYFYTDPNGNLKEGYPC